MKPYCIEHATFYLSGDITYNGLNHEGCKLMVEYKHTGLHYYNGEKQYTCSEEIARDWKAKGKKVIVKSGHWYIDRIAIPTLKANMQPDWWYITNVGDQYTLTNPSEEWKSLHKILSEEVIINS